MGRAVPAANDLKVSATVANSQGLDQNRTVLRGWFGHVLELDGIFHTGLDGDRSHEETVLSRWQATASRPW